MTVEIDFIRFHRLVVFSVTRVDWETASDEDWADYFSETLGLDGVE